MVYSQFVFKLNENASVVRSDFSLSDCHFSLIFLDGLGAKSENLSFVAPPGKRNLVATMAQTHVFGT